MSGQIGLEPTPDAFVAKMVEVFAEVRRVLRDDGVCFLNIGDSYASNWGMGAKRKSSWWSTASEELEGKGWGDVETAIPPNSFKSGRADGLKVKDLCMIPWRVALALQQPYTVPSIVKTEVDRAWLAAMFDGEGCIGVRRFHSYRKELGQSYQDGFVVYTTVTNNDVELLDRCIEVTGLGKARVKQRAGDTDGRSIVSRRDSYGWRLDGNGAVDVIRAIYPYLIAKKKQACIAYTLDTLNKNGHGCRSVPAEVQEKKKLLWELVKKCNQREKVDLPSWVVEPTPKVEPGWYVRSVICWAKKSPMPESVTDRPTSSWEPIFLLAKSERYFYDAEAVKEEGVTGSWDAMPPIGGVKHAGSNGNATYSGDTPSSNGTRNQRNVWHLGPEPYKGSHFACFPTEIPRRAILAGTSEKGACPDCGAPWRRVAVGGAFAQLDRRNPPSDWQPTCKCGNPNTVPCVVLDPFLGSGTTVAVARTLGRHGVGCELNPQYAALARDRIGKAEKPATYVAEKSDDSPLFAGDPK